jgi:glutamate formiminotransferase/formiminotetrahydrofolate cyclodeaminase
MVANLSAGKRGWEEQVDLFSDYAAQGQYVKDTLLSLVDEDTHAFNKIMNAFGLPKSTDEEKKARTLAIEEATKYACEIPFKVMQTAYSTMPMLVAMIDKGNPNSITDAGVGVLCVKTAVRGAYFNVMVNAQGLKDRAFADDIIARAKALLAQNHQEADEALLKVEKAIA